MDGPTRTTVAYIVGKLSSGSSKSSVYDYETGKHTAFSGKVTQKDISVYNHDEGWYMSGSGERNSFSLFHYGSGNYVNLELEKDGQFRGFDYCSGSHFSGQVSDSRVSLFDFEHGKYFNFAL